MLSFQPFIAYTRNSSSCKIPLHINSAQIQYYSQLTTHSNHRHLGHANDFRHSLATPAAAEARGDSGSVDDAKRRDLLLELGLKPELMPKHVAIIMDGNRRWARKKIFSFGFGHLAGKDTMKQLAIYCAKLGIEVLTVFAFSTENWTRPKMEVDFLMNLFETVIKSDLQELIVGHDMQVSVIGERSALPQSLQSAISDMEISSKENKGLKFLLAINYSGLYDITEASKKLARKVKDGVVQVEDINEAVFKQHLLTDGLDHPDPDLLIRTSGEVRLSNFMLCQLAYSELLFVDKLFPDFDEADLLQALKEFQSRQRRFGGMKY